MFEITQETSSSSKILTEGALSFLSKFTTAFEDRRKQLLEERENTQKSIDAGNFTSFPSDTSVRDKDWQVVPPPSDVAQRHVCLLYTSPSPRDQRGSRVPSSA